MSLMNAKKARPVEDASALVPFGWAPGGYHCAACSTCGEAHSGSDKRSARCQDCAEALRDKQAVEPAPTTRETADHAELARLAEAATPGPWKACGTIYEHMNCEVRGGAKGEGQAIAQVWDGPNAFRDGQFIAATNPATVLALLSEIAALRGERDAAVKSMLTVQNAAKTLTSLHGSELKHLRENATFDHRLRSEHDSLMERDAIMTEMVEQLEDRATQAERQRDDLRKALEAICLEASRPGMKPQHLLRVIAVATMPVRALLDNQGADQ